MIQAGFKSSPGIVRENNEDACFMIPRDNIYIAADGVGGNNAGDLASRTAVKEVAQYAESHRIAECKSEEEIYEYFKDCLDIANREVYRLSVLSEENSGMATTIVVAYIDGKKGYFVNIGDSRAYIFREDKLHQITEDHTYVNTLVQKGEITKEDAKQHMQRNVITRALGADKEVEPDFYKSELKKEDIILLCTDGLYGDVPEEDIKEILGSGKAMTETCQELVDKAVAYGGHDNITVICLKV